MFKLSENEIQSLFSKIQKTSSQLFNDLDELWEEVCKKKSLRESFINEAIARGFRKVDIEGYLNYINLSGLVI